MKRFHLCVVILGVILSYSVFSQQDTSYMDVTVVDEVIIDTVSKTKIDSLVNHAKTFIGLRYRYGGTTPAGFDCSGFVWYNFSQFGINLNRTANDQYRHGISVSKHETKPGDLVFFTRTRSNNSNRIDHVGIVVFANNEEGTFHFVHASRRGVVIDHSLMDYYKKRFHGLKRIVDFDEEEPVLLHETIIVTNQSSDSDTTTTQTETPVTPKPRATQHVVRKGDTLYSIARRYGTSVRMLCEINKFEENSILRIGQKIKLN